MIYEGELLERFAPDGEEGCGVARLIYAEVHMSIQSKDTTRTPIGGYRRWRWEEGENGMGRSRQKDWCACSSTVATQLDRVGSTFWTAVAAGP